MIYEKCINQHTKNTIQSVGSMVLYLFAGVGLMGVLVTGRRIPFFRCAALARPFGEVFGLAGIVGALAAFFIRRAIN